MTTTVIRLKRPRTTQIQIRHRLNHLRIKAGCFWDATCAPADIAYPTDLSLLNEAREKLENMIDTLHAPFRGKKLKPRTYRKRARRAYLTVAKQKRPGANKVRKAIGQQLRFIARDLRHVTKLAEQNGLDLLSKGQYKHLLVIQELYRQQQEMYVNRSHRTDDRIVSISLFLLRHNVKKLMGLPVHRLTDIMTIS